VIVDQPAGTLHDNLYRSSDYYYNEEGYIGASIDDGLIGTLVEGDDGCVYIYNPFTGYPTGTWARAERAGGDTLVVRGHQPIFAWDNEVDSLDIFDITEVADEEGYYTFEVSYSEVQEARFLWRDGVLRSIDDKVMGISTSSYTNPGTWEWAKVGERNLVMRPINETVVALPAEAQKRPYLFHNDHSNWYSDPVVVDVAFLDNKVYIPVGSSSTIGDAWAVGTINGDKITFPTHQYLGCDNQYGRHLFFMTGTSQEVYNPYWEDYETKYYFTDEIVFDYDAQTGIFSSDSVMYVNSGDQFIYYYNQYKNMLYTPFEDVAAVPADPILHMGPMVVEFEGSDPFAGYFIDAETPFTDVEGNYLNPDNLYFNIYIDDASNLYTFTTSDYPSLPEDMTNVPALFHDGYVFGQYGRFQMVNFCSQSLFFDEDLVPVVEKVGIQSVYTGGGKENRSNIVWWDITAGAPYSGINEAVASDARVIATDYYDLSGRKLAAPQSGFCIKVVTMSDGTRKAMKLIY